MYNLIMKFSDDQDMWRSNQDRSLDVGFLKNRMFEYTEKDTRQRFASDGTPDFEALRGLPCLFTYEGTDVDGVIGYITKVRYDVLTFTITYSLPSVYPTIRMNNDAAFETLGIETDGTGERTKPKPR